MGDTVEISDEIGVLDPLRLTACRGGCTESYAEYVAGVRNRLSRTRGARGLRLPIGFSVDIITEFLFTLADAQSAIAEKDALDELDAQIPG